MNRQTELLTYKILQYKSECANQPITEYFLDNFSEEDAQVKNVCAKLHVSLVERLDNTLSLLGISKRLFIETAVITALEEFDQLAVELDIDEYSRHIEEAMESAPSHAYSDAELESTIKEIVAEKKGAKK